MGRGIKWENWREIDTIFRAFSVFPHSDLNLQKKKRLINAETLEFWKEDSWTKKGSYIIVWGFQTNTVNWYWFGYGVALVFSLCLSIYFRGFFTDKVHVGMRTWAFDTNPTSQFSCACHVGMDRTASGFIYSLMMRKRGKGKQMAVVLGREKWGNLVTSFVLLIYALWWTHEKASFCLFNLFLTFSTSLKLMENWRY